MTYYFSCNQECRRLEIAPSNVLVWVDKFIRPVWDGFIEFNHQKWLATLDEDREQDLHLVAALCMNIKKCGVVEKWPIHEICFPSIVKANTIKWYVANFCLDINFNQIVGIDPTHSLFLDQFEYIWNYLKIEFA